MGHVRDRKGSTACQTVTVTGHRRDITGTSAIVASREHCRELKAQGFYSLSVTNVGVGQGWRGAAGVGG